MAEVKGKLKRSLLAVYMNTGTGAEATYSLMGAGITGQTISYNPQESEETYIHQDSGESMLESYKPSIDTPQTAVAGDPVFDFVDNLRIKRAVMDEAKTDVVIVYLYKEDDTTPGTYAAEKCGCTISINDFGGDGGAKLVVNYKVGLNGDPVPGKFALATKTFTPDVA